MKKPTPLATLGLAAAVALGSLAAGCGGEPEPPAPSAADFEAAKKDQQDVMQRERSAGGKTAKKAGS